MGMKGQTWWLTHSGPDKYGTPGLRVPRIYDHMRRESRRRGEELFRHDVDIMEFTENNLIQAPGCFKKKRKLGRTQYGHKGRSCGAGSGPGGAKKSNRRSLDRGYEGGQTPFHLRVPKLDPEDRHLLKDEDFKCKVNLRILNMLEDGANVEYQDLVTRRLPVRMMQKQNYTLMPGGMPEKKAVWQAAQGAKVEVVATDQELEEFSTKNLTVFAHIFQPSAREKIEELGGRCVRLDFYGGFPVNENWMAEMISEIKEEQEASEAEPEAEGGEA